MINRTIISTTLFLLSLYSGNMYAQCVCENTTDPTTPINKAFLEIIENNNFTYAFELLESQADPNIVNECGAGLLMFSAFDDRVELANKLLTLNANPNVQNFQGYTPVFIAAQWSSNEILSMLLEAGGNPNPDIPECAKDNLDNTPLLAAAINDNIEGVKILLKYNADFTHENKQGRNALQYLLIAEKPINLIIDAVNNITDSSKKNKAISLLLFSATTTMKNFYIEDLLKLGADPNYIYMDDVKFNTPLLIAAISNNLEAARLLIENGADINFVNSKGYSLKRIINEGNIPELAYLFE